MSHDDLQKALDALPDEGGTATVADPAGEVQVEVSEVDRLGVRIRGLSVGHAAPVDIVEEAAELPERLRVIPERLVPVEVAPVLEGATIRTSPGDMRRREFFEIEVTPTQTEVKRYKVGDDGSRRTVDWTMTREQLEGLVEQARPPADEE